MSLDLGLQGKVAIVTGASMGIGKAIAATMAAEGANVVITARGVEQLSAAAREIERSGGGVLPVALDVNDPDTAPTLIQAALQKFARLDILVNNAGGFYNGSVLTLDDQKWYDAFDYNVLSIARVSRAAIPHLRESGAGRIVNVASIAGKELGFSFAYSVAKTAAIALTKQMSEQLAPDGITVNCVCPGLIRTPAWEPWAEERAKELGVTVDQFFLDRAAPVPLKRFGTSEEVAGLVAFLASSQAGYITGSSMTIDGGYVRSAI